MDPAVLSILLDHIKEQTGYMKQHTSLLTSIDEQHKRLLTSIDGIQAKLNACNLQNKVEDEDHVKNGKSEQKITQINEEVTCDSYVKQLHESPTPRPSSCSSRTEGKKYRLHIVGEVGHETIPDENGRLKMNVFRGKQIPRIEVILKHGDEQVPASHHLASLRVKLVVLEANYYIEESTDWPRKEFENHFFKMVSKTSATGMTVEKATFSLDGGRKVHSVASIKESSGKKKVRLGVMVVDDGSVQERVLEGVSSNEFLVIHKRRRDATWANKDSKRQATGNSELNSNVPGKRVHIDATLPPSASYSQFSGHAQSPQKFGQPATGEQPSHHARNVCSTQNCPTAPIDAGYIGGAVPSPPNSDQGLPAWVHKGISFEEGCNNWPMPDKPDDNQGHVDPSSQNLMMGINPVHENLQGLQTQGQFGDMLQQGNNGTGGAQGQPSTPWSNNLHTNSQTNDFTSAQGALDVGMGGHEQGDGGRVGNGDYGGGNDGARARYEDDGAIFGQLPDIVTVPPLRDEDK